MKHLSNSESEDPSVEKEAEESADNRLMCEGRAMKEDVEEQPQLYDLAKLNLSLSFTTVDTALTMFACPQLLWHNQTLKFFHPRVLLLLSTVLEEE